MRLIQTVASLALLLGMETAAQAITYTGTRTLGSLTLNLSLTTDGTLGALTSSNFTNWNVVVTAPDPLDRFTYTPGTSQLGLVGQALSATATSLSFDFTANGANYFVFAEFPIIVPGVRHFWCVQTDGACLGVGDEHEAAYFRAGSPAFVAESRAGVVVLATVPMGPGGVPEPAAWAMLLAGFGLVGTLARRQRSFAA